MIVTGGGNSLTIGREDCSPNPAGVSLKRGQQAAIGAVPDSGGAIVAGGDDMLSIGRELGVADLILMPEDGQRPTVGGTPDPGRLIGTGGYDALTLGREYCSPNVIGVPF